MNLSQFVGPFSAETYRQRRSQLMRGLAKLEKDFVCIFYSGFEAIRNHTSHFPFRAHSDFLYLTGFAEPEALLILESKGGKFSTRMALRPRDLSPHRGSEIWEGERLGVERAPKVLGLDAAFDIHHADKEIRHALSRVTTLFWNLGVYSDWDRKVLDYVTYANSINRLIPNVLAIRDSRPVLHEMRKVKTAEEVEAMRRSGNIASQGHIRAMATTKVGHFEYQIAAEIEREFRRLGAQSPAYTSIVATGANACTLHYRAGPARVQKGDLILVDAGAELDGYASDITRCYPASGKFTKEQRAIYEVVLESQLAAIEAAKPGVKFNKPHDEAGKILSEGLKALKIIKGQSAQAIFKKGLWKKYMPHGTSHWLGLDVHDAGRYKMIDKPLESLPLVEGCVITVEPGLYFHKSDKSVPAQYRGIGIRIEDDVHVTRSGPEVLTAACPKTVEAIEAACGPRL